MVLSWAVIVGGIKDRRAEVRRVASPRRLVLLFPFVFMLSRAHKMQEFSFDFFNCRVLYCMTWVLIGVFRCWTGKPRNDEMNMIGTLGLGGLM